MSTEPFVYVGKLPCGVRPGSTVTWASSFTGPQAPRVIPADDHVIVTAGYAINGQVIPECQGPGTLTLTPTVTRGYASQTLAPLVLECGGDAPSSMWEAVACYEGDSYAWWPRAPAAFDPLYTSEALVQWRYPGGAWQTLNFAGISGISGKWIIFHNGPVQASWGADPYVFLERNSDRTYREIFIQPIGVNDSIATGISEYRIFAPGATDPAFQAAVVFDRPMIDGVRGQVNTPIAATLLPGSLPIEPLP